MTFVSTLPSCLCWNICSPHRYRSDNDNKQTVHVGLHYDTGHSRYRVAIDTDAGYYCCTVLRSAVDIMRVVTTPTQHGGSARSTRRAVLSHRHHHVGQLHGRRVVVEVHERRRRSTEVHLQRQRVEPGIQQTQCQCAH